MLPKNNDVDSVNVDSVLTGAVVLPRERAHYLLAMQSRMSL